MHSSLFLGLEKKGKNAEYKSRIFITSNQNLINSHWWCFWLERSWWWIRRFNFYSSNSSLIFKIFKILFIVSQILIVQDIFITCNIMTPTGIDEIEEYIVELIKHINPYKILSHNKNLIIFTCLDAQNLLATLPFFNKGLKTPNKSFSALPTVSY